MVCDDEKEARCSLSVFNTSLSELSLQLVLEGSTITFALA